LVSSLSLERKEEMERAYEEVKEAMTQLIDKIIDFVATTGVKDPVKTAIVTMATTLEVIGIMASSLTEATSVWIRELREKMK